MCTNPDYTLNKAPFDDVGELYHAVFTPKDMVVKIAGSTDDETSAIQEILANAQSITVRNGSEQTVNIAVAKGNDKRLYVSPSEENNSTNHYTSSCFLDGVSKVLNTNGFNMAYTERASECHVFKPAVLKS